MVHKQVIPSQAIASPASAYAHAVRVEAPQAFLYVSGWLGQRPDGLCEVGAAAQAKRA